MIEFVKNPDAGFESTLNTWYDQLDKFIAAEEKDKSTADVASWAAEINQKILIPLEELFAEHAKGEKKFAIEMLVTTPKTKKDDILKKLKTLRYALYNFKRESYLNEFADL
ncbi:MAG: hypothetical protein WBI14_01420 [Anaerolineaceae bacterium]